MIVPVFGFRFRGDGCCLCGRKFCWAHHLGLSNLYLVLGNRHWCSSCIYLSCNNWFTSNSFCLRLVFIASRGISPLTTIRSCFILFWKSSAIQISPSDISSGLSVSSLLVPQFIITYLSDCGRGLLIDLYRTFRVL